jgi:hypothetical protein
VGISVFDLIHHSSCNKNKEAFGRLSMSLFRYGLDYVQMAIQRLIGFGKKKKSLRKFWQF